MEPQLHQDQDGRDGERGLKLALSILQPPCRQFIPEEASPLDGVPDLRHLRTQADGLVHRAIPPGVRWRPLLDDATFSRGKRRPATSTTGLLPGHNGPCLTRCRRCSASAKRTAAVILLVSVEASSFLTALSMAFTPFPPD
jgi:hypothetical protein